MMNQSDIDQVSEAIAQKILKIPTLETRHSDSLDFHEVSVWEVKKALKAALLHGQGIEFGTANAAGSNEI